MYRFFGSPLRVTLRCRSAQPYESRKHAEMYRLTELINHRLGKVPDYPHPYEVVFNQSAVYFKLELAYLMSFVI